MNKTTEFVELFTRAKQTFIDSEMRLAADGWDEPWKTLVATIMSAQTRDEVTIPIAEDLFATYPTVHDLADASYADVLDVFESLNYNKNKAEYVITTAKTLRDDYDGFVPDTRKELLDLMGVGRKTANLVLSEVFDKPAICVDTHVHRISNVFDIVDTERPKATEMRLMEVAPKEHWKDINPVFVRWGKTVPGRDKERLLAALD
jgi:endonuclease III